MTDKIHPVTSQLLSHLFKCFLWVKWIQLIEETFHLVRLLKNNRHNMGKQTISRQTSFREPSRQQITARQHLSAPGSCTRGSRISTAKWFALQKVRGFPWLNISSRCIKSITLCALMKEVTTMERGRGRDWWKGTAAVDARWTEHSSHNNNHSRWPSAAGHFILFHPRQYRLHTCIDRPHYGQKNPTACPQWALNKDLKRPHCAGPHAALLCC